MRRTAYTTEPFQTMRDGLRIVGTKYIPAEPIGIPIIVSHGFLGRRKEMAPYAKALASWGCTAYTFDFAGGGLRTESDGRLQDMSLMTEREDLFSVMDLVRQDREVDHGKLALMGHSQGGFVSALAAIARPQEVNELILLSPALCIPDDARSGQMMFFQFDPANVPDTVSALRGKLTIGRRLIEEAQAMDALEVIRVYRGPVLLVHGTADRIVDVAYTQRAKEAYGDNARLLLIDGADHCFRRAENRIFEAALRQFLLGDS